MATACYQANGQGNTVRCKKALPEYSVLMAVYIKDVPEWFEMAIESMANQTLKPKEIVIIADGEITQELRDVQKRCSERYPGMIRCVALEKNAGLAEALRYGVSICECEWIARMDSDDIAEPKRCEEELILALEKNADIVGCNFDEFLGTVDNVVAKRVYPESHDELVRLSRRRSPFCHPAVLMKKSAVLRAGNYRKAWLYEDYDLFVRMLADGAIGCTVPKILFHMRVDENFYRRRGGVRYVKTLLRFNVQLLKMGWMRPTDFLMRSCGNIIFGLVSPGLRGWLYRRFLRK